VLEFCGHSVSTQLTILEFMAKYPKWQRVQKTKSVVTKQSIGDYASICIADYTFAIKCYVSAAEPYVGCSCVCKFTAGSLHLRELLGHYSGTVEQLKGNSGQAYR
jgi:hypothetical protein